MNKIAIYPGTFDPITKGHLHIIERASKLVDHLIVGVASNVRKGPLFSDEERFDMVQRDIQNLHNPQCEITVELFDTLLISYAKEKNASCIFRGLRAVSDFEYEFQMTGMNARLKPDIETVFLMSDIEKQVISSRFVKEIAHLGGDITSFVQDYTVGTQTHSSLQREHRS